MISTDYVSRYNMNKITEVCDHDKKTPRQFLDDIDENPYSEFYVDIGGDSYSQIDLAGDIGFFLAYITKYAEGTRAHALVISLNTVATMHREATWKIYPIHYHERGYGSYSEYVIPKSDAISRMANELSRKFWPTEDVRRLLEWASENGRNINIDYEWITLS